jgi:glycosyltransferase involved in cell wall biosynthesis
MNNNFNLSICILSLNQPKQLERLLSEISRQYSSCFEILIRDDSTNNKSKLVINKFRAIMPITPFYKKKEGIDKAILFLTSKASGKFIWWLGDDFLSSNAIKTVLNVIKKDSSLSFIWANYKIISTNKKAVNQKRNRYFKSKSEIISLTGPAIGFLSSTILKTSLAKKALKKARFFDGTYFANLYIVCSVISSSSNAFLINDAVVICDITDIDEMKEIYNDKEGNNINKGVEIWTDTFPLIINSFRDKFGDLESERVIKQSLENTIKGLIVGWVNGYDNPNGKRIKLFKKIRNSYHLYFYMILTIMPLPVVKLILSLKKWFV